FDRIAAGVLDLHALAEAARDVPATGSTGPGSTELDFTGWARRRDALVVWSSGSSGKPKGIVRSGESVLRNVERTQERMGYTGSDVLLPLLPFTHQYGLSMLLLWWNARATLVIAPSRRVDQALDVIARRRVTVVDAVPPPTTRCARRRPPQHPRPGLGAHVVRRWRAAARRDAHPLRDPVRRRAARRLRQQRGGQHRPGLTRRPGALRHPARRRRGGGARPAGQPGPGRRGRRGRHPHPRHHGRPARTRRARPGGRAPGVPHQRHRLPHARRPAPRAGPQVRRAPLRPHALP
ncbi:AMP-binding protein, partial [Saccharothrix sp. MB29]|nr:AMP-binding protein [Saccharothrix sp. MB29]